MKESLQWRITPSGNEAAVHCLHQLTPNAPPGPLLVSGDDGGCIRLWDVRKKGRCVLSWNDHTDYISAFEHNEDGTMLLASSADCTLSAMDLRKAMNPQTRKESARRSDDQEDELLSMTILKNGRKVVCGTQEGVLAVWSWGTWGDISDRFPGHPASIDALVKVDEDTVMTGSSDGLIRLVQLHPDKFLGVLGDHGGYPIEQLRFNANRIFVGSVSHDNFIRLWDTRVLQEQDDTDEEATEADDADEQEHTTAVAKKHTNTSDAEWSDDEEEDVDSDDSSSAEEAETTNQKRAKRLKTETEEFFADL